MNPNALALIGICAAFVAGLLVGMAHGAQMGIRIFAKDAIILAFQTLDANPERFAAMKDEAIKYPEHEAWIQRTLEKAGKPKTRYTIKDELRLDEEYQRQLREQANGG
jgi:hypothetical protein